MSVRVQMENFGFSQKNTETKVFHTALENHGKFFSRKLNHCNTFILLVYLPITSLPMIVMLLEKWTSWKNDMHLLYVIRLSLPCSWQAKALRLQLLLFFFGKFYSGGQSSRPNPPCSRCCRWWRRTAGLCPSSYPRMLRAAAGKVLHTGVFPHWRFFFLPSKSKRVPRNPTIP